MSLTYTTGLVISASQDINVDELYVAKQHSKYLKCYEQAYSFKVTLPKVRLELGDRMFSYSLTEILKITIRPLKS